MQVRLFGACRHIVFGARGLVLCAAVFVPIRLPRARAHLSGLGKESVFHHNSDRPEAATISVCDLQPFPAVGTVARLLHVHHCLPRMLIILLGAFDYLDVFDDLIVDALVPLENMVVAARICMPVVMGMSVVIQLDLVC